MNLMTRATKLLTLAVLLFSMTAIAADIDAPYGEELWKSPFQSKILWQKLTDCGYLIVNTEDTLYCLNPADGTIRWQSGEYPKLPQDYLEPISGTQYAAITCKQTERRSKSKLVFINIPSGAEVWNSDKFNMADAKGQFFIPEISSLFLFGTDADKNSVSALVDILTGEPFWTSPELFTASGSKAPAMFSIIQDDNEDQKSMGSALTGGIGKKSDSGRKSIGGNQYPVVTPDSNFIEFFSEQGLRKIDSKTGKALWTWPLKTKDVPAIRGGWGQMVLNDDGTVLYVPYQETLHAVNTSDGSLIWGEKGPKLKGKVEQIVLAPDGIVVKGLGTKPYINALDYKTGTSLWKKPFRDLRDASNFKIDNNKIVMYADDGILAINISDGEFTEIAKKVKFSGQETPQKFEVKEDGYLLSASNNIAKYDKQGNQLWLSYFKAPGRSLLGKVASAALVITYNNVNQALAESQARSEAAARHQAVTVYYNQLSPNEFWRLTTSKDSLNYIYISTNVEGGSSSSKEDAGVVKVNKETGNVESRVSLGEKEPKFEIDVLENRIFFQSGASEITCYKL
jgi:outer membrane protein assembly factor BamB